MLMESEMTGIFVLRSMNGFGYTGSTSCRWGGGYESPPYWCCREHMDVKVYERGQLEQLIHEQQQVPSA